MLTEEQIDKAAKSFCKENGYKQDGYARVAFTAGANFTNPKWTPISEYNLEDFETSLLGNIEDKWVTAGYRGFGTFYDEIDTNCPVYPTHFMLKPTI